MAEFDRVLINPSAAELDAALGEAVKAINGRRRARRMHWPRHDHGDYLQARSRDPAGWRQWEGHAEQRRPDTSEVVWTAWWTDPIGRKHHRIVGERAFPMDVGYYPLFAPALSCRPPLALVYPTGAIARRINGCTDVVGCCACGMLGLPGSLGWMGGRCAACHDRREEGSAIPTEAGGQVWSLAWSADLGMFAALESSERSQSVVVWDIIHNCERQRLDEGSFRDHFALSPGGSLLANSGFSHHPVVGGFVSVWDLVSGECRQLLGPVPQHPRCGLFPRRRDTRGRTSRRGGPPSRPQDGRSAAIPTRILRPPGRYRLQPRRPMPRRRQDPHRSLPWEPTPPGYFVGLWDVESGTMLREFEVHCYVPNVAFSPDGRFLAVWAGSNNDPDILLWDLVANGQQALLTDPSAAGALVTFSRDGRFLARLTRNEATVRIWDLASAEAKCHLEWCNSSPAGISFTTDGGLLVVRGTGGAPDHWPPELLGIGAG
jgi:WD40 repeat protein